MHYSVFMLQFAQKTNSWISAISQLVSTIIEGRFCTHRSKILARPAWKIAQTRVQRLPVFPTLILYESISTHRALIKIFLKSIILWNHSSRDVYSNSPSYDQNRGQLNPTDLFGCLDDVPQSVLFFSTLWRESYFSCSKKYSKRLFLLFERLFR